MHVNGCYVRRYWTSEGYRHRQASFTMPGARGHEVTYMFTRAGGWQRSESDWSLSRDMARSLLSHDIANLAGERADASIMPLPLVPITDLIEAAMTAAPIDLIEETARRG